MENAPKLENKGNEEEPNIILIIKEPMMAKEVIVVQEYIKNKPDFSVVDIENSGLTQPQKNLLNQYLEKKNNPTEEKNTQYISTKWEEDRFRLNKNQLGSDDTWATGRSVIFPSRD